MTELFDVIVVGAGPAVGHAVGVGRCSNAALRTAVAEHELVGGECSYWPILAHDAERAGDAARLEGEQT